jgi:hypothetical protein
MWCFDAEWSGVVRNGEGEFTLLIDFETWLVEFFLGSYSPEVLSCTKDLCVHQ